MSLPSSPALQKLHDLDRSLSEFHDQLSNVLYGEEYTRCVKDFQGNDLVWLVDYLDKVRRRIAPPYSPFKSAQALDGLAPSSAGFRKCLRELRSICGAKGILPTSYTLSSHLTIGPDPFASGGYCDVYHGTLDGLGVCIKRFRVYTSEDPKNVAKVCCRRFRFPRTPPLTKLIDLL